MIRNLNRLGTQLHRHNQIIKVNLRAKLKINLLNKVKIVNVIRQILLFFFD